MKIWILKMEFTLSVTEFVALMQKV